MQRTEALLLTVLASDKFTQAIAIEPNNHILYSNRSAVYAAQSEYQKALDDANKATELKPDWAKGWSRKGAAARGLGDLGTYNHVSYYLFFFLICSEPFGDN